MLSVGSNLLSPTDELKRVKVDYLYHSLRNPKPEILSKIKQLRIIRNLDLKQYSNLKRQLPYVVCSTFNPPFRRTENFAYTDCFIVDIDHISDKGLDIQKVRNIIQNDKRVVLCFVSPGEDGLKILFQLKDRCYDAGIYSLFYKVFVKEFSLQYNLEQVLDGKTNDVCRACFVSVDKDAYYNPDAEKIDIKAYIDNESNANALYELKYSLEQDIKNESLNKDVDKDPDSDVILKIKSLLHPQVSKGIKPEPYVPHQLDEIIDSLRAYVESTGVHLYEIKNIQYGKKLRFKMNLKMAEINLFYGKNGFTAVQSPRCGTSADFNKLMKDLVDSFIYSLVNYG